MQIGDDAGNTLFPAFPPARSGSSCSNQASGPNSSVPPLQRYNGSVNDRAGGLSIESSGNFSTTQGGINLTAGQVSGPVSNTIYTNAVPGAQMKVTLSGGAIPKTSGTQGQPGADATIRTSIGAFTGSVSQTYSVNVSNNCLIDSVTSACARIGGEAYYFVDTLSASGHASGSLRDGGGGNASFGVSASLTITAVGSVLNYSSGSGQSGYLGTPLADRLVVEVDNGQTGAAVGKVPVSFSKKSWPPGGQDVSVSGGGTTDPVTGQVSATVTLGSAEGAYIIEATCPSCAVQTVDFSANVCAGGGGGRCGSPAPGTCTVDIEPVGTNGDGATLLACGGGGQSLPLQCVGTPGGPDVTSASCSWKISSPPPQNVVVGPTSGPTVNFTGNVAGTWGVEATYTETDNRGQGGSPQTATCKTRRNVSVGTMNVLSISPSDSVYAGHSITVIVGLGNIVNINPADLTKYVNISASQTGGKAGFASVDAGSLKATPSGVEAVVNFAAVPFLNVSDLPSAVTITATACGSFQSLTLLPVPSP